jgi:hypothetical protein
VNRAKTPDAQSANTPRKEVIFLFLGVSALFAVLAH